MKSGDTEAFTEASRSAPRRIDRLSLFETPLFVLEPDGMEDLNRELAQRLVAEEVAGPGIQRSNVGGWHSTPNLAERPEPCFRVLNETFVGQASEIIHMLLDESPSLERPRLRFGVQAWAMVLRRGDYVMVHDHGEAHWSMVYYVDAGDAGEEGLSGALAFIDPRRGGRPTPGVELHHSAFTVRPRSGVLIMFPGWLQHHVHPYQGERPRISVSCNLFIEST